jgi:hypothetical protein
MHWYSCAVIAMQCMRKIVNKRFFVKLKVHKLEKVSIVIRNCLFMNFGLLSYTYLKTLCLN